MISGEAGGRVLESIVGLRCDAITDGDQITTSLIAACIADAVRKGETPRTITLGLWDSLPSDDDWEGGVRETVIAAIEEAEDDS